MTNKNNNKIFGIIATVVFHAIAVVLLITLCFRTPLPLPGEAGVEVNLGMYAQAMNQDVSEPASQQVVEPTEQEEVVEETEDILSEDEEVPSIEEEKIEEKEEEHEVDEEIVEEIEKVIEEEKPVINQRAIFQVPKNNTETPSEGDSEEGQGEQGSVTGLKDIDRYEGNGGSGGGPAYDLGGRGAKSISSPSKDFNEEGKIVVDIWVDKEGLVKRAEIGRGTTILNESMRKSAINAAKNSIFNKDDKAADLQKGTITYTFIIRQ